MTNDATRDHWERAVAVLGQLETEVLTDESLGEWERNRWGTIVLQAKLNVAAFNSAHGIARRNCQNAV